MKKFKVVLFAATLSALAAAALSLTRRTEPGLQVSAFSKEFNQYLKSKKRLFRLKTPGYAPDPLDLSHNDSLRGLIRMDFTPYDFISAFDLRKQNRLTPVRDQKDCSSCWMFATIGAIESNLAPGESSICRKTILKIPPVSIGALRGGNYKIASAYLARHNGPFTKEDDPYDDSSYVSPRGAQAEKIIQKYLFRRTAKARWTTRAKKNGNRTRSGCDEPLLRHDFS
jgi:C1A family cysteine protease